MTKIQPKIRSINDPIYDTPIFGPTIAWVDGLFIRIICVGPLRIVQTPVEVFAYVFDVQNVTIIDYDSVMWSGVELISQKTFGGLQNQMSQVFDGCTSLFSWFLPQDLSGEDNQYAEF